MLTRLLPLPPAPAPARPPAPSPARSDSDEEGVPARGLEHGAVVALAAEKGEGLGIYKARREAAPDADPADALHVLALTAPDSSSQLEDPAAHFTVVRSGKWIGLWSAAAGGKFLQVRKRGLNRLCFFNGKFGIWEQWEILGAEPAPGWRTAEIKIASRRLSSFVMALTLLRVPQGYLAPGAGVAPSPLPAAGASPRPPDARPDSGSRMLDAVSGIMLKEWALFVETEVASRKKVERQLEGIGDVMGALRREVLGQVQALRAKIKLEVSDAALRNLIKMQTFLGVVRKHRRMFSAWRKWAKLVALKALWFKDATRLCISRTLTNCMVAWALRVRKTGALRAAFEKVHTRYLRSTLGGNFAAWRDHRARQKHAAVKMIRVAYFLSKWKLTKCFIRWSAFVQEASSKRTGVVQYVLRRKFVLLNTSFGKWRNACDAQQALLEYIVQQDIPGRKTVGRILRGWRGHTRSQGALKRLEVKTRFRWLRAALRGSFGAWVDHTHRVNTLRYALGQFIATSDRKKLAKCLRGLRAATAASRAERARDATVIRRGRHSVLAGVLHRWARYAQMENTFRYLLGRVHANAKARTCARVVVLWKDRTAYRARLQRILGRQGGKRAGRTLTKRFKQWAGFVDGMRYFRVIAFKSARRCNWRRQRAVLKEWTLVAQDLRLWRQLESHCTWRLLKWRKARVVHSWRSLVTGSHVLRADLRQMRQRRNWRFLSRAMATWAKECLTRRRMEKALVDHSTRSEYHATKGTFRQWATFCTETVRRRLYSSRLLHRWQQRRHLSCCFRALRADARRSRRLFRLGQRAAMRYYNNSVRFHWAVWRRELDVGFTFRKKMKAFHGRVQRILMSGALARWARKVEVAATVRRKLMKFSRLSNGKLLTGAVRGWSTTVKRMHNHRVQVRTFHQSAQCRAKRAAFYAWSEGARKQKARRCRAAAVFARVSLSRSRVAFGGWMGIVAETRRRLAIADSKYNQKVAYFKELLVVDAFAAWHRGILESKVLAQSVGWRMQSERSEADQLRHAWKLWTLSRQLTDNAHVKAGRFRSKAARKFLGTLFDEWSIWVFRRRSARLLVFKVVKKRAFLAERAAFKHWDGAVQRVIQQRRKVQMVRRLTARNFLLDSFREWFARALEKAGKRLRISVLVSRALSKSMASSYFHWRSVVAGRKILQKEMLRLIMRSDRSHLQRYFSAWMHVAVVSSIEKGVVTTAFSQHLQYSFVMWRKLVATKTAERRIQGWAISSFSKVRANGALSVRFMVWKNAAQQRARLRRSHARLAAKVMRGGSSRCMAYWARYTRDERRRRNLLKRTIARARQVLVLKAFNGWSGTVTTITARREQVLRGVKHTHRFLLTFYLRAWAKYVTTTTHKGKLLKHALARLIRDSLCSALFAWSVFTNEKRKARLAAAKAWLHRNQACMKAAFQAFAINARFSLRKVENALVYGRFLARKSQHGATKLAWEAWCAFAMRKRHVRNTVRKCMLKMDALLKRASFACWLQFVLDLEATRRNLRRAMTTKRVMKDWFIQWYWRAYDDEIQQTLGVLYGGCENVVEEVLSLQAAAGLRHLASPPGGQKARGTLENFLREVPYSPRDELPPYDSAGVIDGEFREECGDVTFATPSTTGNGPADPRGPRGESPTWEEAAKRLITPV